MTELMEQKEMFESMISEKLRLFEEQNNCLVRDITVIKKEDFEGNIYFHSIKIEVE